jgi:hypothetical protein
MKENSPMRNRVHPLGLMLTASVVFSAAWALCHAQTLRTPPKYVLTDTSVIVLSAPQVIAGPIVLDARWSPDGVQVAAVRRTERYLLDKPIREMRFVLWNAARQSRELWRMDMEPDVLPRIVWITPTVATVELKWSEVTQSVDPSGKPILTGTPHQSVLWVDTTREQVKTIAELPGDHLYVSPSRPLAVLFSPLQRQFTLMKPDGTPLKRIPLPDKADWTSYRTEDEWSEDGLQIGVELIEPVNGTEKLRRHAYALNVQTGELRPGGLPASTGHSAPAGPLRLARSDHAVTFGRQTQKLHALWLESTRGGDQPQALLAADSTGGTISPIGSSVLYLSEQSAFVTFLHSGPKAPFIAAIRAVRQSNAKQLGLAMVMYAQDYDSALPTPGATTQDALSPYHKSNDLYDGFNYTFPGGNLPPNDKLPGTELGYVDAPGGRFVIYGDGHVMWRSP